MTFAQSYHSDLSSSSVVARDRQFIWHPLTQEATAPDPIPIKKAYGITLETEDGKTYMDLISSWWVTVHGHAHPKIAKAIADQALSLEHVMFAGFTHEPAVQVAEILVSQLPSPLSKVFFSDNGSTAIEVALKLTFQYWGNLGQTQRRRFVALEKSYHGDTFGAMAVGKGSGFFDPFFDLLCQVDFLPLPETWMNDDDIDRKEEEALKIAKQYFENYGHEVAALIVEPLIQGAAGMRMYRPSFLQKLVDLAKSCGIFVIFDEIMTGFGRTGTLFACQQLSTPPDIICLSKALTGGFLPLAVTVCTQEIYNGFLDTKFSKAFTHSHSFMGNPLGCAAALASLSLFEENNCMEKVKEINNQHHLFLTNIGFYPIVEKTRCCGPIAAWAFKDGPDVAKKFQKRCLEEGMLIRPLGETPYLIPPYCIKNEELSMVYLKMEKIIQELCV